MKQFFVGLVTVLVLVVAGVLAFRGVTGLFGRLFPTPSASPVASMTPTPDPSATSTPKPSANTQKDETTQSTTKGGLPVKSGAVKGVSSTTTKTVTTTTTHMTLTLVKTNECRNYMTEVRDITGPLTLKRWLKPGYSIKVTVWAKDGNELLSNTTYSGSGDIKIFSNVDYIKVRMEPADCPATSDTWVQLTAER